MKQLLTALFFAILMASDMAYGDPMDELVEEYSREFDSVKPAPNSSVGSDYKFDQMAMSGMYATRSLRLIYQQNQEMIRIQQEILNRYDRITEQNREIIRLLTLLSGQDGERAESGSQATAVEK